MVDGLETKQLNTSLNPLLRLIAMHRRSSLVPWTLRTALGGIALAVLTLAATPVSAQPADDNPFGAPEEPAAGAPADDVPAEDMPAEDTPAAGADNPFGAAEPAADNPFGGAAADEAPAAADVAEPAPAAPAGAAAPEVPRDPVVLAVLESHPETPFELLRAIRILNDLGHPQQAAPFVERLTGQNLDRDQQAALFKQFPSAMLMRMARNPELSKSLGPFIDGLYRAADEKRRDPTHLAEWIKHLNDPAEAVRAQATEALLLAGEAAVAPLVTILADPNRVNEQPRAKRILIKLGKTAVPPLLGVLESPDESLKLQVVEVLGAMQAEGAAAALLGPLVSPESSPLLRAMAAAAIQRTSGRVPNSVEALALLQHAARRRLEASREEAGDGERVVEVWQWDPTKKQSVPVTYDPAGASLASALRLAADLHELDPQSTSRRRLYLITLLQAAKLAGGMDKPLSIEPGTPYALATGFGPHAIEDALAGAMAQGFAPAAIAAAQILGDIGSAEQLAHGGATPSALVRAAGSSDRRLRFTATAAIMKLATTAPFAGSSHVTEALGFFAGSYGVPRVLIAHPLSAEGGKLAGLAAAQGYEADVATTGRQAYELAIASPDYDLALIHAAIGKPAVDELVAQLRRDRRTAELPVGLIAPLDNMERVQNYARRAGNLEVFLQPQNDAEMKLFVGDVLAHAGRSHVSVEERRQQALAAIDWLVALAQSPGPVFNIGQLESTIIPLVYVPDVAGKAIELLSDIGTEPSQKALVQLADNSAQPLATRQAAVTALARSIRRYGTLLTSDELYAQYDLYNLNAGRNRDTHRVLGALLDVLEHRGDPPPQAAATGDSR